MTDFDYAQQSIEQSLESGQIGTPVAVRLIAHAAGPPETGPLEAWAQQAASRWLRSAPVRSHRFAADADGHAATLVAFAEGQSAVLCTGPAAAGRAILQITVFGNHGVITWSDPAGTTVVPDLQRPQPHPVRPPLKPPYGVLLIAGHDTHQPMYAPGFQADSRCRLVGVSDETQVDAARAQKNARLAAELQIPLLPDLDQALERDDVQIVSVCAEPMRRGPLIERAARAGKHLYLDKPLAGSSAAAARVVAEVQRQGVLAHMFSSMTAAPISRIERVLKSGQLGRWLAIHCELCFAKGTAGSALLGQPRRENFPPERYEVLDAKRELTNVGVYPLTLLAAWSRRKVRRVAATTGNYFFAEHQARDMEDFGQIVMQLEGGVIATCVAGRTGWQSHPAEGLNRVCLIGSQDAVLLDAHWPRAETYSDAEPWLPPSRDPADPMGMWVVPPQSPHRPRQKAAWHASPALSTVADVRYFLDCLESGCESQANAAVAAAATEILAASYRAAAEQTEVAVRS